MKTSNNHFFIIPSVEKQAQRDNALLRNMLNDISKKKEVNLSYWDKNTIINIELKYPIMTSYNKNSTISKIVGEKEVKMFIEAYKNRGSKKYPEIITNLFNQLK